MQRGRATNPGIKSIDSSRYIRQILWGTLLPTYSSMCNVNPYESFCSRPLWLSIGFTYSISRVSSATDFEAEERVIPLRRRSERTSSNLPNPGATTVNLETFGTEQGPTRGLLNIGSARDFDTEHHGKFRASLELLNATNSVSPWAITWASGTTFNKYTSIDTPIILRAGLIYTF
jgi:hypothetical protein